MSEVAAMHITHDKVLIVVNSIDFLRSHRLEVLNSLVGIGIEVHVAFGRGSGDLGPDIMVHRYKKSEPSINLYNEWECFTSILSIFRKVKPNAIHLLTIKPHIYGLIIARLLQTPHKIIALAGLGQIASSGYSSFKHSMIRALYKGSMRGSDVHFIVQNDRDREYVRRHFSAACKSITQTYGSGVDLARYAGARSWTDQRPLKCVFAARLLRSKGVMEFFDIAKRLQGTGIEFSIFGERDPGNPDSISELQERALIDSDAVYFRGFVDDMAPELKHSDLMLYPSIYGEGIPKILLEASASGLPVITTDNPGCAGLLKKELRDTVFLLPIWMG